MKLTLNVENKEVYDSLIRFLKSINIKVISEETDNEDFDWKNYSTGNLSKSYSSDEPEYNLSMLKEPNPEYERK